MNDALDPQLGRPIFVIGTGRSGTHWLGYSLGNHPEIRATIERQPMFTWSTTMALRPDSETRLLERLIAAYERQLVASAPRHYLDKSHPNIWIADKLKQAFPNALFIGIERNPYATVSSMMKHEGVAAWHQRWREFPLPNRFLGIGVDTAHFYDDLPLASQCAMRWVAHHNRMIELEKTLADSLKVISYESFAQDTERIICELQRFLGLSCPIAIPEVRASSLNKWRRYLSDSDTKHVCDVVRFPPEP